MPPVYTATGAITAATEHIVRGSTPLSVGNTSTVSNVVTVTLSGAAIFASISSYTLIASYEGTGTTFPTGWGGSTSVFPTRLSGSSLSLQVGSSNTSTSAGTIVVDWVAIGT
jgi:hypothetical protein